ncbi:hypothetical protein HDU96_009485, partial [Phlyctochytrium bullatum]
HIDHSSSITITITDIDLVEQRGRISPESLGHHPPDIIINQADGNTVSPYQPQQQHSGLDTLLRVSLAYLKTFPSDEDNRPSFSSARHSEDHRSLSPAGLPEIESFPDDAPHGSDSAPPPILHPEPCLCHLDGVGVSPCSCPPKETEARASLALSEPVREEALPETHQPAPTTAPALLAVGRALSAISGPVGHLFRRSSSISQRVPSRPPVPASRKRRRRWSDSHRSLGASVRAQLEEDPLQTPADGTLEPLAYAPGAAMTDARRRDGAPAKSVDGIAPPPTDAVMPDGTTTSKAPKGLRALFRRSMVMLPADEDGSNAGGSTSQAPPAAPAGTSFETASKSSKTDKATRLFMTILDNHHHHHHHHHHASSHTPPQSSKSLDRQQRRRGARGDRAATMHPNVTRREEPPVDALVPASDLPPPSIPPLNLALPRISIESIYRHGRHVIRGGHTRTSFDSVVSPYPVLRSPRASMSKDGTSADGAGGGLSTSPPMRAGVIGLGRRERRRRAAAAAESGAGQPMAPSATVHVSVFPNVSAQMLTRSLEKLTAGTRPESPVDAFVPAGSAMPGGGEVEESCTTPSVEEGPGVADDVMQQGPCLDSAESLHPRQQHDVVPRSSATAPARETRSVVSTTTSAGQTLALSVNGEEGSAFLGDSSLTRTYRTMGDDRVSRSGAEFSGEPVAAEVDHDPAAHEDRTLARDEHAGKPPLFPESVVTPHPSTERRPSKRSNGGGFGSLKRRNPPPPPLLDVGGGEGFPPSTPLQPPQQLSAAATTVTTAAGAATGGTASTLTSRILEEFLTTERTFVHELSTLFALYVRPFVMVRGAEDGGVSPVVRAVLVVVFGNLAEVLRLHVEEILPGIARFVGSGEAPVAVTAGEEPTREAEGATCNETGAAGCCGTPADRETVMLPSSTASSEPALPWSVTPTPTPPPPPPAAPVSFSIGAPASEADAASFISSSARSAFRTFSRSAGAGVAAGGVVPCLLCGGEHEERVAAGPQGPTAAGLDPCYAKVAAEFRWMAELLTREGAANASNFKGDGEKQDDPAETADADGGEAQAPASEPCEDGKKTRDDDASQLPAEARLTSLFLDLCHRGDDAGLHVYNRYLSGLDVGLQLVEQLEALAARKTLLSETAHSVAGSSRPTTPYTASVMGEKTAFPSVAPGTYLEVSPPGHLSRNHSFVSLDVSLRGASEDLAIDMMTLQERVRALQLVERFVKCVPAAAAMLVACPPQSLKADVAAADGPTQNEVLAAGLPPLDPSTFSKLRLGDLHGYAELPRTSLSLSRSVGRRSRRSSINHGTLGKRGKKGVSLERGSPPGLVNSGSLPRRSDATSYPQDASVATTPLRLSSSLAGPALEDKPGRGMPYDEPMGVDGSPDAAAQTAGGGGASSVSKSGGFLRGRLTRRSSEGGTSSVWSSWRSKKMKRHSLDPWMLFGSVDTTARTTVFDEVEQKDAEGATDAADARTQESSYKRRSWVLTRRGGERRRRRRGTIALAAPINLVADAVPDAVGAPGGTVTIYPDPGMGGPSILCYPTELEDVVTRRQPEGEEGDVVLHPTVVAECVVVLAEFARIIWRVADDSRKKQLGLGAYLVLPLQRLTRYGILLDRLVGSLDPSHPHLSAIEKAANDVRTVIEVCNGGRSRSPVPKAKSTEFVNPNPLPVGGLVDTSGAKGRKKMTLRPNCISLEDLRQSYRQGQTIVARPKVVGGLVADNLGASRKADDGGENGRPSSVYYDTSSGGNPTVVTNVADLAVEVAPVVAVAAEPTVVVPPLPQEPEPQRTVQEQPPAEVAPPPPPPPATVNVTKEAGSGCLTLKKANRKSQSQPAPLTNADALPPPREETRQVAPAAAQASQRSVAPAAVVPAPQGPPVKAEKKFLAFFKKIAFWKQMNRFTVLARGNLGRVGMRSLSSQADDASKRVVIYEGPIARGVKVLKRVSVATLGFTFSTTPLFALTSTSPTSTAAITIMVIALATSTASTAMVQYCCNPYVASISKLPASSTSDDKAKDEAFEFETFNFFGSSKRTKVAPSDLGKSSRVFSTWSTSKPENRHFYIHPELQEGFSPDMERLIEKVENISFSKGTVGDSQTSFVMKEKRLEGAEKSKFDELVKNLRQG